MLILLTRFRDGKWVNSAGDVSFPVRSSMIRLESGELGLDAAPLGQGAVLRLVLHVDSVGLQLSVGAHLPMDLAVPLGEAPLLGDVDLLAPWELELGPPERLDDGVL